MHGAQRRVIVLTLFLSATLFSLPYSNLFMMKGAHAEVPSGSRAERNWEYINHDSWGTNYSPQSEINKDNAHLIEMKWVFPFPPASEFAELQPLIPRTEGSMTPPIIVDGTVFVASNMRNVYAIDAETGKMRWENLWNFDWPGAYQKLPLIGGASHIHGMNYIDQTLFTSNVACSIRAINASTGKLIFQIEEICRNIDGNRYNWPLYGGEGLCGLQSNPPVIYGRGGVLITGICGADLNWGGRSFIDGYDISVNPPRRIWRTFLQPPSSGDAQWALRNCERGFFFSYKAWIEEGRMSIPCTEVPMDNLMNDWGVPKHYTSAVSELWGQIAIDEEAGIAYLGTGNQAGWINQTYTPGPNLYAASIMALNAMTGEIIWWYQTMPRDMVQGDAGWNTILASINLNGQRRKAIIKFTTTGLVWALDAATGAPIWVFEAPFLKSNINSQGILHGRYASVREAGPNSGFGYWNDVRSYYDMQEKKWLNYPSTEPFEIIPFRAGEADIAFDPERGIVYVPVSQGWNAAGRAGPHRSIGEPPGEYSISTPNQDKNTTIFAVNAVTGREIWSHMIDGVAFRGGVIVSGGVVFVPSADGFLYMLDADNGNLLHKRLIGTALVNQPTIGKTSDGESRLFLITGGRVRPEVGGLQQKQIPGALLSFGLPKVAEPIEPPFPSIFEGREPQIKVEPIEPANTQNPLPYLIGIAIATLMIATFTLLITKRRGRSS